MARSKSIQLSQKYGVNPSIPVCFWCGEPKNEIALLGRISKKHEVKTAWGGSSTVVDSDIEAPKYMVLDYEPCEKCRNGMALGVTLIEATSYPNTATSVEMQKGVYPTGRYIVVKREAAERLFPDIGSIDKAFVGVELFNQLTSNG